MMLVFVRLWVHHFLETTIWHTQGYLGLYSVNPGMTWFNHDMKHTCFIWGNHLVSGEVVSLSRELN